ncbi:MAG: rane protein [Bacteroidetes bacterium]|nr:rane protein [Bacteroidota bacterium]
MKNIMLFLAALFMSCHVMAQQNHITGTITDANDGSPMIGANVMIKGTKTGTISDISGEFNLNVPQGRSVLIISSIGYKTQEVTLKSGQKRVEIAMHEDSKLIDEVVVVGYGTMKKSDLSGSVGQIKSEDLLKGNPSDLSQGLQGKMAGVLISQNDGAPGAGVSISVRGTNSFSTSSQPLYIVDGVPFDTGDTPSSDANANNNQTSNPLAFINPHDIQSIEVLKDASATAIYGSRGANGVVIITTKRGEGKDQVEFSSNFTLSKIGKRVDVLDAETYANYINEETLNSYNYSGKTYTSLPYPGTWSYTYDSAGNIVSGSGTYQPAPSDYRNPGTYSDEYGNSTVIDKADWQDLIYQTGFSQEYNLRVSGGSDKGWHSFSGNYLDQSGIIKNTGFTRYSLRANIGRHINSWLEMGMNTNFTRSSTDFTKSNAYDYALMRSALLFPPTYGPNMDTTTADNLNWLAANPYAYVNSAKDNLKSINVFNSSYLEATLFPFLKFRQNLGLSYTSNRRGTYYDRHTQEGKSPTNGKAGQSDNEWNGLTGESLLTFNKKINVHAINVMAGFTIEHASWQSKSITVTNFPDDLTGEADLSRGTVIGTPASDKGEQALVSFLGRANYVLMDKYIFTTSFRRDGSSKFTTKNKWANFLSAAFAWRASEEKFIKNLNIFSNLKFRLSYGETGNQGISSYRTLPELSTANYPFGGTLSSGSAEVSWRGPVSDDLKWETTAQFNAGIDMSFLENRINLTADYYYKKTRNLLQEVKIPSSTGFSNMMVNSGGVINEGLELSGNFIIFKDKPFHWDINANISFNKNEITGLSADQYANSLWYSADDVFIQRNGCPIGAIFGYVENGFYDNEAEVRSEKKYANSSDAVVKAKIGEIRYRDLNDDGEITEADRTIIGNTNPDFTYGITNNLSYKNFNFSFFLQGSQGNDIFNGNLMDVEMANIGNIPVFAYNSRWTEDNTANAKWPKAISTYDRTMLISNRYVENGSYLKLKTVSLGYTWKPSFKGISSINVYFTATNLLTISDYSWFDPDVNAFSTDASRKGVDIYSYPSARTFSLGFKLGF